MATTFNFQRTEVYLAAREVAVMVHRAGIRDSELRDQATRAAKSCFLNVSEGLPSRMSGVRRRHFAIALGSLGEACAALDLAVAIGAVDETRRVTPRSREPPHSSAACFEAASVTSR